MVAYELALLQFRPDVTSEEVVNIGVVAFSPEPRRLAFAIGDRYGRVKALYPQLDGAAFRAIVTALERRAEWIANELSEGRLLRVVEAGELAEVQSLLVPRPGGSFTWSSTRYGTCSDLEERVRAVFAEYIGRHEKRSARERVDEAQLRKRIRAYLMERRLPEIPQSPRVITSENTSHEFMLSWKNGSLQVADPISFDYAEPAEIESKALTWRGRLAELASSTPFQMTAVVTDRPSEPAGAKAKYESALAILRATRVVRKVIPLSRLPELAAMIEEDTRRR
jgi:hypothetical protein